METNDKLAKVRKVSQVVKKVCKVLLWMLGLLFILIEAAIAIGPKPGSTSAMRSEYLKASITWDMSTQIGGATIPLYQPEIGKRIVLMIFLAMMFAIAIKAQVHLYKLFANYAEGRVFTAESVAQIKQLGITILLAAGTVPLGSLLAAFVFSAEGFTTAFPMSPLITGGLIILISWVMDAATALREENDETI